MKILIIEDEPSIADTIQYALKTEGFETVWCSTLAEGKRTIDEGRFDLLLLDVGLPDGHGFDFCKELRKSVSLPVIFLTARSDEIDKVVGLEIGADDYITKPFSPRELTARVRAVLRRGNNVNESEKSAPGVGPFSIDDTRYQITFHGKLLELSRYEFKLLKKFLSNPERVYSREQLMLAVWDDPSSSLERTVDAHVKGLRAKLREIAPESDHIITHRGIGYSCKVQSDD